MAELDPRRAALLGRIGGLAKSSRHDPKEGTAAARARFLQTFEERADPDGQLGPEERRRRAEVLRRMHFARLALKSAEARRARKKAAAVSPAAEGEEAA